MDDIKNLSLNLHAPIFKDIVVDTKPMQDPSKDPILREYLMGGMRTNRDIRMILDVPTLQYLLSVALQSKTQRCVINRAGIRIKVRRAVGTEHVYETLHIEGHKPYPEQAPDGMRLPYNPLLGHSLLNHKR